MNQKYILLMTLLLLISINSYSKEMQNFYNVKYLNNYDGDTATFEIKLYQKGKQEIISREPVRLRNYNTEEIKNKNQEKKNIALKQKEELKNLLINSRKIDLLNCKKEKYGRLLCDLNLK